MLMRLLGCSVLGVISAELTFYYVSIAGKRWSQEEEEEVVSLLSRSPESIMILRIRRRLTVPTLYLSAPKIRTQSGPFYRDFLRFVTTALVLITQSYAIYTSIASRIHPGTHVMGG